MIRFFGSRKQRGRHVSVQEDAEPAPHDAPVGDPDRGSGGPDDGASPPDAEPQIILGSAEDVDGEADDGTGSRSRFGAADLLDERPLTRADRVGDALAGWTGQARRLSTGPSMLQQVRIGRHHLDLTHAHPSGLAQLLAARSTLLSSLVREGGALADARRQARRILEISERYADELGLVTCHLAIGEATWDPEGDEAPVHAPVLVRPLSLAVRGTAREDVELGLDSSVDLNPYLLRKLREAGVSLDTRAILSTTQGPYGFDPNPVLDAFRNLGEPLPGFRISHSLVVGNVVDAVGPLVDDLSTARPTWTGHSVIAALADDADGRDELVGASLQPFAGGEDPLVVAADADQQSAIDAVHRGSHLEIAAPPGTDANGTLMALIAELAAKDKKVLVVSQRRAHLAEVVDEADDRGLGSLVLDLSPSPTLQTDAVATLGGSLRRAGSFTSTGPWVNEQALKEASEVLAGHVGAMHAMKQPWGVSAHEALEALADLTRMRPAPRTTVRLPREVAARMIGPERDGYRQKLREAAANGALSPSYGDSAWAGSTIASDSQAARARTLVHDLAEVNVPRVMSRTAQTGPEVGLEEAADLHTWGEQIDMLVGVRGVLDDFVPAVFESNPDDLIAATATKQWRDERGIDMGIATRRRLRRHAADLVRPGRTVPELHAALLDMRAVRQVWSRHTRTGAWPTVPQGLAEMETLFDKTQRKLDELVVLLGEGKDASDLSRTAFDRLQGRLDALISHEAHLEVLPRQTEALRDLAFEGLGPLADDLRGRGVGQDGVGAELDLSWWTSVLELIAASESTISSYDGQSLAETAAEYRRLDADFVAAGSNRVRQAVDARLVETMKSVPQTSRDAIAELSSQSTPPLADLLAKYEDLLLRARPIWLASPYLVPQMLPQQELFDIVIIADAGRLPTAAAASAIMRARQVVAIGDPFEYGGGPVDDSVPAEDSSTPTGDEPGEALPQVMDDLHDLVPTVTLSRDTRPGTGRIRGFVQECLYGSDLRSVPSPVATDEDRLVFVEDGSGPVSASQEFVESTEAELARVTDLVVRHARETPDRSLAVLTLTRSHANRLMERIMATVSVMPAVREFFSADRPEPFSVLPADQASSVVRDVAIFSLGFGRTPHNRVIHKFGPLSSEHGRRALTSVLSRSRRSTVVVSSLRSEDLDPARLRTEGARDLKALLAYLEAPVHASADDSLFVVVRDPDEDDGAEAADTGPAESSTEAVRLEAPASAVPAASEYAAAEPAAESAEPAVHIGHEAGTGDGGYTGDEVGAGDGDDADDIDEEDGELTPVPVPAAGDLREPEPGPVPTAEPGSGTADAAEPAGDPAPAPAARRYQEFFVIDGNEPEEVPVSPATPGRETSDAEVADDRYDPLIADLADRLWRRGYTVHTDYGHSDDRLALALGHPDLPGRLLVAVETDGADYIATPSQRERDRLRAERLERAGWYVERVWSWALFIDPQGEAERIASAVETAFSVFRAPLPEPVPEEPAAQPGQHTLPRPYVAKGLALAQYSAGDFDAIVEWICSDGVPRLEEQLASEVRREMGFPSRSVLLDVSVASAIRRFQENR